MPDKGWQRLGEMLRRRREDLDPRYGGRGGLTLFAEERGVNRRVAWDIENAKRDNYTRAMLRDIEGAYGLDRRGIDRFLAGRPDWAAFPGDAELDALAEKIWELGHHNGKQVLDDATLRGFIVAARHQLEEGRASNPPARQQAAG